MSDNEGTIDASGNYPANGVQAHGDCIIKVIADGGSAIAGTVQVLINGSWKDLPGTEASFSSEIAKAFTLAETDRVRLNVSSVTGNYLWSIKPRFDL